MQDNKSNQSNQKRGSNLTQEDRSKGGKNSPGSKNQASESNSKR